jgi:alanine racemase
MGPRALIDTSAFRSNLQRARKAAPGSRVIAVIKANAYGHGMLRAARLLDQADAFGVARVGEGVELRQSGVSHEILVLEGAFDQEQLIAASTHDLQLVINSPWQLELLNQPGLPRPVVCWLKVDTGMHRLGFAPQAVEAAYRQLQENRVAVRGPVRLMTHLANGDDLQDHTSSRQIAAFMPLVTRFGVEGSIANSAGILGWPSTRSDWNRPGIMLYGASPFIAGDAGEYGLKPVMTLESRLIAINHYHKGARIGYSGTWACPEPMPVGVVAIGYGDGYPRHTPSGTPVLLNDHRVPLIGRVSMDMITIDLRRQRQAHIGDRVTLWGRGLPADEIARAAGTIAYELFCGVTARVDFQEI